MTIEAHIKAVVDAGGQTVAIDFNGATLTWDAIGREIEALDRLFSETEVDRNCLVGLLGRNRPEQVSTFIAVLGSGRPVLLINALRPASLVAEEIAALQLKCLIGSADDLTPEVTASATALGTMLVRVGVSGDDILLTGLSVPGAGPFRKRAGDTLIEIQTSGTTGTPKRIPIREATVEASLRDGVRSASGATGQTSLAAKSSPTLMFGPLVHTSGTFNTLMSVFEVRPIVLFEKFDAEAFRQALVRYRPKFAPLPPSAIKMMVDSDATREDFASVRAVRAGTAPLPVDLQIAFEEKFGVPVLVTYGATEFMGAATSWTLDDHHRYAESKRGSVGRANAGVELRIVDPTSREPVPTNQQGILEARIDRIDGGREWIATTDIARIDADGFLFILGRSDDAIIRGGFKIMAGKVAEVLLRYPGIYDAIVVGRPDERLGEVPVAVVEPYPGSDSLDGGAIRDFARQCLTPYEVPARIHVVDSLPRTVSDKISRPQVQALLDRIES